MAKPRETVRRDPAPNLMTLTVGEVMARTGWPRSMVYRLMKSGSLATIREGDRGRFRVLEASLEDYFATQTKGGGEMTRKRSREALQQAIDDAVLPEDGKFAFS